MDVLYNILYQSNIVITTAINMAYNVYDKQWKQMQQIISLGKLDPQNQTCAPLIGLKFFNTRTTTTKFRCQNNTLFYTLH